MHWVLAFLLLLAGCRKAEPAVAAEVPEETGPCRTELFDGSRFTVCSAAELRLELHVAGRDGRAYRSFAALNHVLGQRAERVAFAVNAGMFDEGGLPIGLAVADGRELKGLNRRDGGGNFHLKPNGVFLVRDDGSAAVVPTEQFKPSKTVRLATQSGPMLLIGGKLHPRIEADGRSRFVRNAVGVDTHGVPLFVISEEAVSFGKLARLFRDRLGCRNALYLDGSVSSLWDPAGHRMDSFSALGPMIVALRDEEERR
ncbi:phosphodiester glycosidase family protein [Sphingomonas sp. BN140010]|uniref:Phosphodiester glycosidase family protein n=1 Tax=Sphingomonas arvum TaxID=2992113 RepID=A0ABT3JEP9_9SPHN|nr:phosphodiester glycosidase family protein [Sphingomonas sp. BN140010]MCW3797550.1 phosphodiester glycosidase family protein [Sphingomonas sp. BN140010]